MTAALEDIATPPGINALDLLLPAVEPEWRTSPDYRRYFCRDDVVLFAYTYLFHHLTSPETGGRVSFAAHHLAMAQAAERWSDGRAHRDIMISPRGSSKSTWAVISILHAMAFNRRRVWLICGLNAQDIGVHMDTIREELRGNALLLADFPHLAATRRDNSSIVVTKGGCAVAARGLDAGASGFKVDNERPSGIWIDDPEPDEGSHSEAEARRRLGVILNKILPMNDQAAVLWTGTVTMFGSILHRVVLGYVGEEKMPDWILDGRWTVHYVPALQLDRRGREFSFWETRYPVAGLRRVKHTDDFALNMQGRPVHPGAGKLWRPEMIHYLAEPVALLDRRIYVDVAVSGVTTKARHDFMAVLIAGRPAGHADRMVIEYARTFHMTGGQLLTLLGELCEDRPDIHVVNLEANQGGQTWKNDILTPMPTGVNLELRYASKAVGRGRTTEGSAHYGSKDVRIRRLLRRYERDQVIHAYRLPELETGPNSLMRYPQVEHDDLIDDAAAAADDLLPMAA